MIGLWDIHNHILPGVDDGSSCIDESVKLVIQEYEQGVRNIVLTPHVRRDMFTVSFSERYEMFIKLRDAVSLLYKDVNLYLGAEIFVDKDSLEYAIREPNTMCSLPLVLAEFPVDIDYDSLLNLLDQLKDKGLSVIVAHIERYKCLSDDINRVNELKSKGCYVQVNSDSVISFFGLSIRRFVNQLIKNGLVDFVASDCHSIDKRSVNISKAYELVKRKYGSDIADRLFHSNAERLFSGAIKTK